MCIFVYISVYHRVCVYVSEFVWLCMYIKKRVKKESESESRSVVSDSLWPRGLYSPWNPPGQNTGVVSLSLLQGIFPTQGSDPDLLYCRRIPYELSYEGNPSMKWGNGQKALSTVSQHKRNDRCQFLLKWFCFPALCSFLHALLPLLAADEAPKKRTPSREPPIWRGGQPSASPHLSVWCKLPREFIACPRTWSQHARKKH